MDTRQNGNENGNESFLFPCLNNFRVNVTYDFESYINYEKIKIK